MPRKGNSYTAAGAVAEAIKLCGWNSHVFFANAKRFACVNGFDAAAEAKKFEASRANPTTRPGYTIPPPVVAFANWALTKEKKDIHRRFDHSG